MVAEQKNPDSRFYLPADDFFLQHADSGLTYDDVTLATLYSDLLPRETILDTTLAQGIDLHLPIISADMDTVTEHRMAIAMALNGGLGLIHYNMTEKQQLKEVSRVKNHVHGLIQEPITITPNISVGDVIEIIENEHENKEEKCIEKNVHNLEMLAQHEKCNYAQPKTVVQFEAHNPNRIFAQPC